MFLLSCYTGLRFSDITTLTNEHIQNGWIRKTMVKTNKEIAIPITQLFNGKALTMIQKYPNICSMYSGLKINSKVNRLLKDILSTLNLQNYNLRNITFHTARHTCASLLSEAGYSSEAIQIILGHTKQSTTQIYMNDSKESKLQKLIDIVQNALFIPYNNEQNFNRIQIFL